MRKLSILAAAAGVAILATAGSARMLRDVNTSAGNLPPNYRLTLTCLPDKDQCTHKVGRLWFTITNYGFFGNQTNIYLRDCVTGGYSSSAEFPGGSRIEYLYQGALWIGAVVGGDTVTSIGTDGWVFDPARGQFHAECDPAGMIIRRSRVPTSPYYDSLNAVSDQDFIAVMYDTLTDPTLVMNPDPQDGKPFRPMGLKIIQKSYSWAAGWGQDWVMLDYSIVNLGQRPLSQIYLGPFLDCDIGYYSTPNYFQDDLSGFKLSVPNEDVPACQDTINLAYSYDRDGNPSASAPPQFTQNSPTAAAGVRVVRAPIPLNQVKTSFNWWTPNGTVALDWGPQKAPGRKNFSGGLGQPEGNAMKYFYLSNGEHDYDQVWSAVDQSATDYGAGTGWMPPLSDPSAAVDIANGFDTRYVVSFGPFNLKPLSDDPSDTLRLTFAFIMGADFHRDPGNFSSNLGAAPENMRNPVKIQNYLNGLHFDAIATNARWVARVFDNENLVDTVFCGDPPQKLARHHGDGIPDFKGPQPPPAPIVQAITDAGEVTLRWFGKNTETARDEFVGGTSFEGYRIQMSQDGQHYTVIGSFDKVDWKPYFLNTRKIDTTATIGTWQPTSTRPLSWDEIQQRYAVFKKPLAYRRPLSDSISGWDTCRNKLDPVTGKIAVLGHPIDPDRFGTPTSVRGFAYQPGTDPTLCKPDTSKTAIRVRFGRDTVNFAFIDTVFYFAKQDYNLGLSQIKMFPKVTDPNNDSSYWYQYKISGLSPSQPVYLAVTPFTYGLATPSSQLDPMEATPTSVGQLVWPLPNEESRRYSYAVFARPASGSWAATPSRIMSFAAIQQLYAGLWDSCRTVIIDPEKFNAADLPSIDTSHCRPDSSHRAIAVRFCGACGPGGTAVDSFFYFRPSDSFKISVYPNPYRVDNDYSHYENPRRETNRNADLHRILNFVNLPAKCVIRIYTLDGDLVQEIRHDKNPDASDAGYESWNLLTRNAQMVTAGLYLYTVQSSLGIWTGDGLKDKYVGKIVIIK